MRITVGRIAEVSRSGLSGDPDREVGELLIDSRKAAGISRSGMFIALRGSKNDGHDYIGEMYSAGLRSFLVDADYPVNETDKYSDASFVRADNTLDALQKLAGWKRDLYEGNVISITGSNGKTIVKEWLSDILGKKETVYRSPRSYNSQVGVPLSLWKLSPAYSTAVIEAGMSKPGEIERLERIIRPHTGIFTHIGEAHQENFPGIDQKVKEKLKLFRHVDTIIYPLDKADIHNNIIGDSNLGSKNLFTWSVNNGSADVVIKPVATGENMNLEVSFRGNNFSFTTGFSDSASLDNLSTVIACLLSSGWKQQMIREGLKSLSPVAMRMEQKEGINNCLLLEDFYNSDPGSLQIALDHLRAIAGRKMTLILSDFLQGRQNKERLYSEVATGIKKAGVNRLIAIGKDLNSYRNFFEVDTVSFYESTDEFVSGFREPLFRNEAILLKGARQFEFERIGRLLELKTHQTRLDVNLASLLFNLNTFRSYLDKNTAIMAMVKAFAYGAGPGEISEWLAYNGVDYLAVAYTGEGIDLRKYGISKRIMVMSPDIDSLRSVIEYDLEPEIHSIRILNEFISELKRNGIERYPVHIKLDTGMHRLGFMQEDLNELCNILNDNPCVRIASVFSHLAAADDRTMDDYTQKQVCTYLTMSSQLEQNTKQSFLRHILNSAGVLRFPKYQFDMVRTGIGLYGVSATEEVKLKTVASFFTRISQVKTIPAGEGIGYGLSDVSDTKRKIAILPAGYADGLKRLMGKGRGRVFANGQFLPIVGNVCMDMCMVDISNTDLRPGDKVEIFGDNISIEEVAGVCKTIPYEILTGIPPRVKRIFLYE
ncbi:MAG: bifunctional UDP-N-acetylmuramoyl-tripeptide:D-alanyl-D-alanine ligase/alanine racemase [Bacteroidales bacterium]|nr:bifunctional UDP-N-acetylmuramoyl-tripeptide:D-alanyl-D-alanine ligase/alanine racemase [Bacteroidales bacterium]